MDDPLDHREIMARAKSGVAIVGARAVVSRAITTAGFLFLATALAPRDFGLLALGMTIIGVSGYFADFGLAAALVRRAETPTRSELSAVQGFSLLVSSAFVAAATIVAALVGGGAVVTALMAFSLPVIIMRSSPAVLLERRLDYVPLAIAEVAEASAYVLLSAAAVLSGAGVTGVAATFVLRPVVGYLITVRAAGCGFIWPNLRFALIRPILAFGAKAGSGHILILTRDQGLNLGTGAIAGLAPLGVWSLVGRLLQAPQIIVDSTLRVSFPALSRLTQTGADVGRLLPRAVGAVAVVLGFTLTLIVVASQRVVPAVLGAEWSASYEVIRWTALGVLISAPITAVAHAYLMAVDRVGRVLKALAISSACQLAVGLGLLPVLGVEALGLGVLTAGIADFFLLGHYLKQASGVEARRSIGVVVAVAVLVGAGGLAIDSRFESDVATLATLVVSAALYLVAVRIAAPSEWSTAKQSIRGALRRQSRAE
jgi:O-antigen/teichoic acid export membrane protein